MCYHPIVPVYTPSVPSTGAHVHYHIIQTITITYQIEIDVWT
jgi:hypothetical protein